MAGSKYNWGGMGLGTDRGSQFLPGSDWTAARGENGRQILELEQSRVFKIMSDAKGMS